jgi:hypothetical protein
MNFTLSDPEGSFEFTFAEVGPQGPAGPTGPQGPAGSGGGGDVVGPASATDNAIARFDGTTGKLVQNSLVAVDDSGNVYRILAVANGMYPQNGQLNFICLTDDGSGNGALSWQNGEAYVRLTAGNRFSYQINDIEKAGVDCETGVAKFTNVREGVQVTSGAGGEVTLTVDSPRVQILTGTTSRTYRLPTIGANDIGLKFEFHNITALSAIATIIYSDGATAEAFASVGGRAVTFVAWGTGTGGVWNRIQHLTSYAAGKRLSVQASLTLTGTDLASVDFGDGGVVVYSGGALDTPASGDLTNCTGLPIDGISATGTPSASTFLRGDGTWATPSGGGITQQQAMINAIIFG